MRADVLQKPGYPQTRFYRLSRPRGIDKNLAQQARALGKLSPARGSRVKGARVDQKPTLASQGISKSLAQQARVLGKLSDESFEAAVAEARANVAHRPAPTSCRCAR
jgi:hypothetical protein